MATFPVTSIPPAGLIGPLGATVAGGDDFTVSEGDVLVFQNGHTGSITVNLVAVAASVARVGAPPAPLANEAKVIPAGEFLFMPVSGSTMSGFINATTGRVAVTYTGHNAALKAAIIRK